MQQRHLKRPIDDDTHYLISEQGQMKIPGEIISPDIPVPSSGVSLPCDRTLMALTGPPSTSTRRTSLAVILRVGTGFCAPAPSTVLLVRSTTAAAAGAASRTSIRTIVLSHATTTAVPAVPACCTLKEAHGDGGGGGRQEATLSDASDHAEDLTMLTESGVTCKM